MTAAAINGLCSSFKPYCLFLYFVSFSNVKIYLFNLSKTNSEIKLLVCYIVKAHKIREKIEQKYVHFCNHLVLFPIKNI